VPEGSPIWRRYRGSAWGSDMYGVLGRSKITVNEHIDLAEDCANNMRLFEATGMGTLLVTDWKPNIGDMFVPGEEVVCYRNPEECLRLVRYYLDHEDERARIAAAGQRRTLRDHGFGQRAAELVSLFAANCPNLADGDRDVAAAIPAGRLGRKQNFR
jgi:spore maturation protein CgeB